MTRFAPGQVVTVFRSRLRADAAPGYHDTADEMLALAQEVPGFVDYKAFHADDGERVSLVTFADHESQRVWREHLAHREAQRKGRSDWYASYSLQVGECTTAHEFEVGS
ncbi:MAG: antibiotic biosynthesis monooxygenase [Actinomycetia bacterium]|nr:antibiotic biosynthesis monooxygenase [Actinomycetes bacterium]